MNKIYQVLENMGKVCESRLEEAEEGIRKSKLQNNSFDAEYYEGYKEGLLVFQNEIKKQIKLNNIN